jgi:hypothetical protein
MFGRGQGAEVGRGHLGLKLCGTGPGADG